MLLLAYLNTYRYFSTKQHIIFFKLKTNVIHQHKQRRIKYKREINKNKNYEEK